METEIIDKLFLELSQVTTAKTAKELRLEGEVEYYRKCLWCIVRKDNMTEQGRMAKSYLDSHPTPTLQSDSA